MRHTLDLGICFDEGEKETHATACNDRQNHQQVDNRFSLYLASHLILHELRPIVFICIQKKFQIPQSKPYKTPYKFSFKNVFIPTIRIVIYNGCFIKGFYKDPYKTPPKTLNQIRRTANPGWYLFHFDPFLIILIGTYVQHRSSWVWGQYIENLKRVNLFAKHSIKMAALAEWQAEVQESFSNESDWIPACHAVVLRRRAKSIAGMTTKFDFSLSLTVMPLSPLFKRRESAGIRPDQWIIPLISPKN